MNARPWALRRFAPADETAVLGLLVGASLPTSDLDARRLGLFVVAEDDSGLLGVAGLEPAGSVGLLRSVVVAGRHRGRGLGRALVDAAEQQARQAGIHELYLLTTTAAAFFGSVGYELTPRDAVPGPVAASAEFARLCPASAVCMHKVIRTDEEVCR